MAFFPNPLFRYTFKVSKINSLNDRKAVERSTVDISKEKCKRNQVKTKMDRNDNVDIVHYG